MAEPTTLFDASPPVDARRYVRVWADSIRHEVCRGQSCGAAIVFAQNIQSQKRTPFLAPLEPLGTEVDRATGRKIYLVDFEQIHFRNCPDANRFSAGRRR